MTLQQRLWNRKRLGTRHQLWLSTAALLLAPAVVAHAQDRPSEQEMFGGAHETVDAGTPEAGPSSQLPPPPAGAPQAPVQPRGATQSPQREPGSGNPTYSRDEALLGRPDQEPQLSAEVAPEDPLRIGGLLYLRSQTSVLQDRSIYNDSLSAPSILDTYLDARPNERVRAFILGRLFYDPSAQPPAAGSTNGSSTGGVTPEYSNTPGIAGFQTTRGPQAFLDQMWIKFDIKRTVFITAGKQHFKWGTGRFWTPTDYLHPIKRNPLSPFDARLGLSMLKVHLPWEQRGWNFYGVATVEQPNAATNTLGSPAVGGRAEVVLGAAEIGVDGLAQRGQKPRLGFDVSAGIWDLDFYADVGIRWRKDFPKWTLDPVTGLPAVDPLPAGPIPDLPQIIPQTALGATYARKYNDNDVVTFGSEYFYNAAGYPDQTLYPVVLLGPSALAAQGITLTTTPPFTPFYLGRHYIGVFANVPAPYSWNYTTFNVSLLANLSDKSFVGRVDYSLLMLTHLRFEAYAMGHFGTRGGEFRFALDPTQVARDIPALAPTIQQTNFPAVPPSIVDLGVALRVNL